MILRKAFALSALILCSLPTFSASAGTLFSQREVDQNRFVAIASPYGSNAHQLLIVEQIANSRACWSESGNTPTVVDPLLVTFDFTNICGRSTDSNGYSIRMAGEDLGWRYSLRVVHRNGDMVLVGVPTNKSQPELQIARARGFTNGFAKLHLEPGWRMTRREFNGQTVGHVYLTNDRPLTTMIAANPSSGNTSQPRPTVVPPRPVTPAPSRPITVTPPVPRPVTVTPPVTRPVTATPAPAVLPKPPAASVPIRVPQPETRPGVNSQPGQTPVASGRPIPVPLPTPVRPAPTPGTPPVAVAPTPIVTQPVAQPVAQPKPAPVRPVSPGDYVVPVIGL